MKIRALLILTLLGTLLTMMLGSDGELTRVEGVILLVAFLVVVVYAGLRTRRESPELQDAIAAFARTSTDLWLNLIRFGIAAVLLYFGSRMIVRSAPTIGEGIGMAPLLTGLLPVGDCFRGEPGLRKMVGDQLWLTFDHVRETRLQQTGDLLMVPLPGSAQQRLVRGVLNQRMLERVPRACATTSLVEQLGVGEIRADGVLDAGVLDLDGHLPAVAQHGTVHLTDGGGRHRMGVPVPEELVGAAAELTGQHLLGQLGRHRGRLGLERGQRRLSLGRQRVDDERHELADLHGHALHRLFDVVGRFEVIEKVKRVKTQPDADGVAVHFMDRRKKRLHSGEPLGLGMTYESGDKCVVHSSG